MRDAAPFDIDLPRGFRAALDAATRELAARPGVAALLFFGSAARGAARAGSDLDLYAVTHGDARGHLGQVVDGVPVEVSFGSLAQWRALVEGERPAVVHAFATGRLLFDHTAGAAARLCADAAALWARGPAPPDAEAVLRWRFRLTDAARDLEQMPERAPESALAGAECVRLAVEAFCAARRVWAPPARHALAVVGPCDPAFAAAVRDCADAGFPAPGATAVADLALEALGGRLAAYDTTDTTAW